MRPLSLSLLAALLLAAAPALAQAPQDLVGSWQMEVSAEDVMELRADGTATMAGEAARWSVSGNVLTIGPDSVPFRLEGNRLVLTMAEGVDLAWVRVGGGKGGMLAKAAAKAGLQLPPTLMTRQTMTSTAKAVKGNFRRPEASSVLVAGEPPLTYGSVAAFVSVMGFAFQMELTESEFELIKAQFIESYARGDAGTKASLATGGQQIWGQLQAAAPEQREGMRAELRQAFEQRLQAGAQAGIGWAASLWDAVNRRRAPVAEATTAAPAFAQKPGMDNTLSQADLEASLEMLYFMWVACGRDASAVTPEAAATVRNAIAQGFPGFPPQVQYMFANAQQVYGGLRGAWERADANGRAQLAQQFSQALDYLGLRVPQKKASGGGAWDDMAGTDMSRLRAETLANSAYLSTNSWYKMSH